MKRSVFVAMLLSLGGCLADLERYAAQPPYMTPVGSGLIEPTSMQAKPVTPEPARPGDRYSLWQDGASTLFRNPRAVDSGDVLTVHIEINDRASLDSSIDRSRDAENTFGLGFNYDFDSSERVAPYSIELDGDGEIKSGTSTKGKGSIARSENIRLAVAAVVTDVLPNGNLVIKGTQEVRVNHEVRVLTVAGIVRPQDVTGENTIAYDKIAEARISYGGRGRIDDVNRPGWGQRLYDKYSAW